MAVFGWLCCMVPKQQCAQFIKLHSDISIDKWQKLDIDFVLIYWNHCHRSPEDGGSLRFMNLLDVKHCLNASQNSKFFMEQCCHLADCTRKTEVLVHTKKEKHFWSEVLFLNNERAGG